jgi:hypothetical protein
MNIPEFIYNDILINYTNVHDNYLISKYIKKERDIKIKKAIIKINKLIYKHILEFRIAMDMIHYHIPKIYYKKFYPFKYRKNLMLTTLEMSFNENYEYQKELYDDLLKNTNHFVINFNKFIDSMSYNDLFLIGW